MAPPIVLLVDGTCVFCNRLAAFVLRRDRRGEFGFAHIQSELAADTLARHGLAPDVDVVYAVTDLGGPDERVHLDGEAGRVIWPRLFRAAVLFRWTPLPLLNVFYRAFARLRYPLFGQADRCIVPSPEQRARFLS